MKLGYEIDGNWSQSSAMTYENFYNANWYFVILLGARSNSSEISRDDAESK